MKTAYIDSACDIYYSSYYIKGFIDLGYVIKFSSKFFSNFDFNNKFLAVVVNENDIFYKIIIDYGDASSINENAYEWSDVYAKINLEFETINKHKKLISIGPSFGIKIYNPLQIIFFSLNNFIKAHKRVHNYRRFFSNYKAVLSRLPLSQYENVKVKNKYVFFLSTIWKNDLQTNNFRLNFIKACNKIDSISFEGGFVPRNDGNNLGYDQYVVKSKLSLKQYILKLKQSFIVFNTPAVLNCHGWKLAEYLALGKVIVSTKISRELPADLVDKQHILFTDGSLVDIKEKIESIMKEQELFENISINSKKYFINYLQPKRVCNDIINFLK